MAKFAKLVNSKIRLVKPGLVFNDGIAWSGCKSVATPEAEEVPAILGRHQGNVKKAEFSADEDDHDSDYGSDALTNLDSNIFQSIASQAPTEKINKKAPVALRTRNIATNRVKVLPVLRAIKAKKGSNITKNTKPTHPCFYK